MSFTSKIRERLIRLLWDEPLPKRTVIDKFDKARRSAAQDEISVLLSDGAIIQTGMGKRGSPTMLQLSPVYPFDVRCPLCNQQITPKATE